MTDEKLRAIHDQAMRDFDKVQSASKDERLLALEDRRFYSIAGAQWEGSLGEQFANKPKLEVNKIHLSVMRIFNEWRNNRITVDFIPMNDKSEDSLADLCDGLYRADEQDSVAEEAYDNAFEEAVGGGFGAWRLRAEYEDEEDEDNDHLRIKIEPIFDADSSVFFDINAKRQDKSDAKYCFVITGLSPDAYEELYDESPSSVNKEVSNSEFDWNTSDIIYVAEYYRKEEVYETIVTYESFDGEEQKFKLKDLDDEKIQELIATGNKEVKRRKVKTTKVHKYIMSGDRILEDLGYIAGKHIPIVPMYGKRWFIDGVERFMGHVRLAKDSQRLKNMQISKLAELAVLSATQKPILTPEQIVGHEIMWSEDNVKNNPYLLINPITDINGNPMPAAPVGYTQPPIVPPALAAILQLTETDIQDILGNQQAGEQMNPNLSGKAVELIQNRLDMQSFIYMSNMAKAIKRSGQIWLSMASEVYVEPDRKMKTVGAQEEIDYITLNQPVIDDESGKTIYSNDLSNAKFDITVDIGPSSSSKRSATVRNIMNMMQVSTDPETVQVLGSMAIMNMEGEGIQDVRDFFRQKMLRIGAVKPTDKEKEQLAQEMQNQQPDAQSQYLQAAAAEAQAKAIKAEADTGKALAEAEATKAKTAEILSGISRKDQETILKTAESISNIKGNIEKSNML